jgi:hypothetical protein
LPPLPIEPTPPFGAAADPDPDIIIAPNPEAPPDEPKTTETPAEYPPFEDTEPPTDEPAPPSDPPSDPA